MIWLMHRLGIEIDFYPHRDDILKPVDNQFRFWEISAFINPAYFILQRFDRRSMMHPTHPRICNNGIRMIRRRNRSTRDVDENKVKYRWRKHNIPPIFPRIDDYLLLFHRHIRVFLLITIVFLRDCTKPNRFFSFERKIIGIWNHDGPIHFKVKKKIRWNLFHSKLIWNEYFAIHK